MTTSEVKTRKKLIEVALPLEVINAACVNEASPFTPRHPRSLHVWWARRRLAAARSVILAQLLDDPSSHPELFPTEDAQQTERQRLFRLMEQLVKWENTTNESLLEETREEIRKSWRLTCAENETHLRAKDLFNPSQLPAFYDPFAGGGALPLEAQRLGLEVFASDLNPVAVLINKGMIEIPSNFVDSAPVNSQSRKQRTMTHKRWSGVQGIAEDLHHYGKWMRDTAEKRIGHLFPKVEITTEMARGRSDLRSVIGQKLDVIAWLWVRTVPSPNPAFAHVDVPLTSTFMLSNKPGKEAYVEPVLDTRGYAFSVKIGKPKGPEVKNGTKLARGANFRCLMSEIPIEPSYIYAEAKAKRMGARLMAIVVEGDHGRLYLPPTKDAEAAAKLAEPEWKPNLSMPENPRWFSPPLYGLKNYSDLFTSRQIVALDTFCGLVQEVRELIKHDAAAAGISNDERGLEAGGTGVQAYSDALAVYFGLAISRWTDLFNSLSAWNTTNQNIKNLFSRQAIPMVWDFAESNPFGVGASFTSTLESIVKLSVSLPGKPKGHAFQLAAGLQEVGIDKVVSTDPPYYDNIGYADLSDFFYVWLRRSLDSIFPNLFSTVAVPKTEELIAAPYRHGGKEKAEAFFLNGMTQAMHRLAEQVHPAFPVTIYYAFKQSESESATGTTSTGWETFLEAVFNAGFALSGTWPMRTERTEALKKGVNALASSIVLVCRARRSTTPMTTRREFLAALKSELPVSIARLQRSNIAPVDLAQAAIGPGMAVYTRYSKVVDAEGKPLPVRGALALINQTLDEVLAQQEGDFDADTRWALAWFEQFGFEEGDFGTADVLARAKNTSVRRMVEADIILSKAGKVRLRRPNELLDDWHPLESRIIVWEAVHHLVHRLERDGEAAAAELARVLGGVGEVARELAYRLYNDCTRKKRTQEALSYNALVQSWPEITKLAREISVPRERQAAMFAQE